MVLQLVKAHRALVRAHVPIPAPMLRADGTAIADADADAQSVRLHALKHAVANRHVEFSSGAPRSYAVEAHTLYAAAAVGPTAPTHCYNTHYNPWRHALYRLTWLSAHSQGGSRTCSSTSTTSSSSSGAQTTRQR